jgi:hypothetical protein
MCDVAASVHQGAERHVATNARKAVEISEFHGMPPRELPVRSSPVGEELIVSAEAEGVKRGERRDAGDGCTKVRAEGIEASEGVAIWAAEFGSLVNHNIPLPPIFFITVDSKGSLSLPG